MHPWRHAAQDLLAARTSGALAVVLLLVQAAMAFARSPEAVFFELGLSREKLVEGRIWQPMSYALLHGGWVHLAINLPLLLSFGSRLERIGGGRTMIRVLLGGVLGGAAGHLLATPGDLARVVLVGVSGGIVAMLLWLTAISPDSRMWPLPVSGRSLGLGILVASALLALMDPGLSLPGLGASGTWLGTRVPGVFDASHACHFGGGVAGWLMARWTLRPRVTLARLQAERARRELAEQRAKGEP